MANEQDQQQGQVPAQNQMVPAQQAQPAIVSQDTDIGRFIASEVQADGKSPADASAVLEFFQDHAVKTRDAAWALGLSVTLTVLFAAARTQFKQNKLVSSPYWFIPLGVVMLGTAWRYYAINAKNNELRATFATLLSGARTTP